MLTTYIGIQRHRKQSDGCQELRIGENWEQLPTGYRGRVFSWVMKMLWNRPITQPCEWTTCYEMFTFTWLVWCYVNFISKGKKKIRTEMRGLTGWGVPTSFQCHDGWMLREPSHTLCIDTENQRMQELIQPQRSGKLSLRFPFELSHSKDPWWLRG